MRFFLVEPETVEIDTSGFDLVKTLTCGQCFRWQQESDGSFTGVVNGSVINAKQQNSKLILYPASLMETERFWTYYFGLRTDYIKMNHGILEAAPWMEKPIDNGNGIHLLNQDPWETTISFLLSANNNIKRIAGIIERLSEAYGTPLGNFRGQPRFAFPTPDQLIPLTKTEWELCGTGYRSVYLFQTVRLWEPLYQKMQGMGKNQTSGTASVREMLETLPGVGPKVSACIALFAFGETRQFPVDVWVRRMVKAYWPGVDGPDHEIETKALELFGDHAGYAQQLLFYLAARKTQLEHVEGDY